MKLANGYGVQNDPVEAVYRKNENGLYTLDYKHLVVTTPNGDKLAATITFPNVELSVDDESGVIDLRRDNIQPFITGNDDTIWEIVIPDTVE